jgi:hypothetical protein
MEEEGVRVGGCVPLSLTLAEELRVEVAHALCVALPHCDREGVKLAESHTELVRLSVTEEENVGDTVGE